LESYKLDKMREEIGDALSDYSATVDSIIKNSNVDRETKELIFEISRQAFYLVDSVSDAILKASK